MVVVALGRANSTGKGLLLQAKRFLSQMANALPCIGLASHNGCMLQC